MTYYASFVDVFSYFTAFLPTSLKIENSVTHEFVIPFLQHHIIRLLGDFGGCLFHQDKPFLNH